MGDRNRPIAVTSILRHREKKSQLQLRTVAGKYVSGADAILKFRRYYDYVQMGKKIPEINRPALNHVARQIPNMKTEIERLREENAQLREEKRRFEGERERLNAEIVNLKGLSSLLRV